METTPKPQPEIWHEGMVAWCPAVLHALTNGLSQEPIRALEIDGGTGLFATDPAAAFEGVAEGLKISGCIDFLLETTYGASFAFALQEPSGEKPLTFGAGLLRLLPRPEFGVDQTIQTLMVDPPFPPR